MPFKDPKKKQAYDKARRAANIEILKVKAAQYAQAHKPELAAYHRKYRKEKPHVSKKARAKWAAAHPTYKADYHLENRDKQLAQLAAWLEKHPGYYKDYSKTHPEEMRVKKLNRRARKKGLPDTWTLEEQAFMFAYWHNTCAICNVEASESIKLSSDHWLSLASVHCPGTVAHNMLPLCFGKGGCNNRKGKTHPERWLNIHFGAEKAARILHAIAAYFAEVQRLFPSTPSAAAD